MKILIVRFSSIGDIVLTSPVIRIAKNQLAADVHYLTKHSFKSIISKNPNIDKIFTIDKNINEVIDNLKSENYDYIIDLHNSLRSKILKFKLNIKSFSVTKANYNKWQMVNFKRKHISIPHIVNRYVDTLKRLGAINDQHGLDFFYTKDVNLSKDYKIPDSYICISLGAKHFTKKIPTELLTDIISGLNKNIVLIGGNDVIEESKNIVSNTNKSILNLAGKLNLHQSAQVIDNSNLVLSSDTGMMHIAAALQKRIVVIWGNTVPEFGMYPYYGQNDIKHINIEVEDLKCRPCSKIGFRECPKEHFNCMLQHKDEKIISSIIKLS